MRYQTYRTILSRLIVIFGNIRWYQFIQFTEHDCGIPQGQESIEIIGCS